MERVGFDATTGEVIKGWAHVAQSLQIILTTSLGERLQRRRFGSNVPDLIDAPQNAETVIDFYVSTAEAIEPRVVEGVQLGEPCFSLLSIEADLATPGHVSMALRGVYFPRGHRGIFDHPEAKNLALVFPAA